MLTIATDVYTLDELEAAGDERAVERALEWMLEAWGVDAEEHVSELLSAILRDAFGSGSLAWDSWDYWRGEVVVSGSVSAGDSRVIVDGPLAGMSWPGGDLVESFTYRTSAARSYGRVDDVWLYVVEDGPSWHSPEYDALCDEVVDWVREVEARLTVVMREEFEYLTGREYLRECCVVNGYTFTVDGKRFG